MKYYVEQTVIYARFWACVPAALIQNVIEGDWSWRRARRFWRQQ